ncbi:MAG: phosphate ABC transporter substrate-binding protein PstS [Phycisphaerae bacterium]|nr:phosphate ABC transporter substrate-binding protein PstS [Phycisphaerae bacterium]
MKRMLCVMSILSVSGLMSLTAWAEPTSLTGAGATFPYPIYSQWAYKYEKLTGVKLNYQSIGSGGGIAQIKAGTVDFGASDAPLDVKELEESGLIQFPMVIGGVVPVINVPGIDPGKLVLSGELLADIYLGKIKKWNDNAIVAMNADLKLPNKAITVVRRADGSGTTFLFTSYLGKVSKQWREKIGVGKAVAWPVGVGGKGNEGVASYVQKISGSIGYVEFAYALQNKMAHVQMKNKAGKIVAPGIRTFQAAAANAQWDKTPGYAVVLTDQPGEQSWPIAGASFILIHKKQLNGEKAGAMLKFFDWCYKHGSEMAEKLDFVAIPANVVAMVEKTWKTEVKANDNPVWP